MMDGTAAIASGAGRNVLARGIRDRLCSGPAPQRKREGLIFERGVGPQAPQKKKAPLLGGGGQWGDGDKSSYQMNRNPTRATRGASSAAGRR